MDICIKFTKTINRELIPINALTRSLISYRAINSYFTSLNKIPSILEIGAGSGYLGLFCGLSGWQYSSVDVTKSLVCYQNSLWNFAGLKVKFAETGVTYSDLEFMQIPWWVWTNTKNSLPERKMVVANHVIQEMTPFSLSFTLKRSKELGAEYILAEGLGYNAHKNNLNIIALNTELIHNTSLDNNYQKVWIWKITNNKAKTSTDFNSVESSSGFRLNKQHLISVLLKYRFSHKLYRKINSLKARKARKINTRELLYKSMLKPKLIFDNDSVISFVKSKKVPFITDDEIAMKWANHHGHI